MTSLTLLSGSRILTHAGDPKPEVDLLPPESHLALLDARTLPHQYPRSVESLGTAACHMPNKPSLFGRIFQSPPSWTVEGQSEFRSPRLLVGCGPCDEKHPKLDSDTKDCKLCSGKYRKRPS